LVTLRAWPRDEILEEREIMANETHAKAKWEANGKLEDWLGISGKTCVVTGAAGGIGAAVALSAAQSGANVALLDKDIERARAVAQDIVTRGGRALALACDTTDEHAIGSAVSRVEDTFGECSLLVNNAGISRSAGLESVSLSDWNLVLSVNLTGYLLVARAFLPLLKRTGGGSIVHIASISSNYPQPSSGAYSAAKAGVLLMSRQMAVEWGKHHIRSNAICPGMVRTGLSADFYAVPGVEQRRAAVTPVGRIAEPQDIANATLFLLSDKSAYMSGAELAVDGGLSSVLMDMVPRPGYNDAGPT
jgi:NAD(P)-dependent dehydrogenase (short-subunit alcohol dehydrogenase family)